MSEFTIIDRVTSYEYLLRDRRIQNPIKSLRWSALEKYLQLVTIFAKNSILNF